MWTLIKHQVWTWVTEYPSGWWSNTYTWGWKSFNPTENLVYWWWQITYPDIAWESYSYNMSWVNAWTEIFLCMIVAEWPIVSLSMEIINPVWQVILSYSYSPIWAVQWTRYWGWVWLRHWEIEMNGTYNCRITFKII